METSGDKIERGKEEVQSFLKSDLFLFSNCSILTCFRIYFRRVSEFKTA